MGLIKVILLITLLALMAYSGYYVYDNYLFSDAQGFSSSGGAQPENIDLTNISGDIAQFYENMRFNHNDISFFIDPQCSSNENLRMKRAFAILSGQVPLVSFFELDNEQADILVACSPNFYEQEKNQFVVGEGGPTRVLGNLTIPVIEKGKIILYNQKGEQCDYPITEIHELLHVFGYEHINKSDTIMYPYSDCDQKLDPELISHMIQLYSIKPEPALVFQEINGYQQTYLGQKYLSFNLSAANKGMIAAENVMLIVYSIENSQETQVYSADFKIMDVGDVRLYSVENIKISSSISTIKFLLKSGSKETSRTITI